MTTLNTDIPKRHLYDWIIIGAGITGITLCKKLKKKYGANVLVLEAEDKPGGLCRTVTVDGHILDIGGGHFFNSKHQEVLDFVFSCLPKVEFNYYKRVSKIEIGSSTIDYPLESNVWQLPLEEKIAFLISIIRNGQSLGKAEPGNYEEWIRWKLGDRVCDDYMIPYNRKLWGVEPREMDIDWLHKIPQVNVEEVLRYALEGRQDVQKFPAHVNFYYPKHGGFQRIFDALYRDEAENVRLGERVHRLVRQENKLWDVNKNYLAKNVINTAPWNDLYDALEQPDELREEFRKIRYNRVVISLHEKEYTHDWHWRYIPNTQKAHHREFFIKNFAAESRLGGIYLETNVDRFDDDKSSSNAESIYHCKTNAAYPIPVLGHAAAINKILDYYRPQNLFGIGRWGQHQYQNADVSIYEAMKFVDSANQHALSGV